MSIKLIDKVTESGLPTGQRFVLLILADACNDEGTCYPSQATIIRKTGMGKTTVGNHLAWLEMHGLISRYRRQNSNKRKSDLYQINVELLNRLVSGEKLATATSEHSNSEHSNSEHSNSEHSNSEHSNSEPPNVQNLNLPYKKNRHIEPSDIPHYPQNSDCADALVAANATTGSGDLEFENLADNTNKPLNPASLAESANNAAAHSGSPKRKAIAPVPVQQVLQTYNEVLGGRLPNAQLLNDKRKRVIAGRWKEMLNSKDPSGKVRFTDTASGLAWFAKFFAKVALNPHWLGENDRGWRADLDWILKPDNFLRILEWRPK